jgi:hypothetical protein
LEYLDSSVGTMFSLQMPSQTKAVISGPLVTDLG